MSQIPAPPTLAPVTVAPTQAATAPAMAAVASNATPPTLTPAAPVATLPPEQAKPAAPAADPSVISLSAAVATNQHTADTELDIASVFTKAGLDPKTIAAEYSTNGTVSDETVRLIQASDPKLKFMAKGLIRDFVAGQAAIHTLNVQRVQNATKAGVEAAGGEDQHKNLLAWMSQNVDPARLARFDTMLKSDPTLYSDIIKIIDAEYKAKNGAGGTSPIIRGQTVAGAGVPTNKAEMGALMARIGTNDKAALAVLNSMTQQQIESLS